MVLGEPFWTYGRGKDTCLFFMCLLRKPNIILAVKGKMLKRIAFIVLEQPLKGKFEAERQ